MSSPGLTTIYFVNNFGTEKVQIPFPVAPNIKLIDIMPELAKKLGISSQNICIAKPGGGNILTNTELLEPIKNLVEVYRKVSSTMFNT